jgi:hypothetical protein
VQRARQLEEYTGAARVGWAAAALDTPPPPLASGCPLHIHNIRGPCIHLNSSLALCIQHQVWGP